jgi:hypothetical protein
MRSTRNRTRAVRAAEHHHYTDRLSAPLHSSAPTHNPGTNPATWRVNTNSRLRDGGISSYYRPREIGYGS